MTDKEKKEALCIFITPSERLGVDENGKNFYKYCFGNEKKYFEKFYNHAVLQLEYADQQINPYGINAIKDNNVKNVQVIFAIHGNEEGLTISEAEMHKILDPILGSLGDKKLEILMVNCQGSLKFNGNNGRESLPVYLKAMAQVHGVKPENISLYCMPKGHNANIQFNKDGDIFFISNGAENVNFSQDNSNGVLIDRFYKKQNQEDHKHDLQIAYKNGCWYIPAEEYCKGGETNILKGVYKNTPPI